MNLNDSSNSTESLNISTSPKETSKLIPEKVKTTPSDQSTRKLLSDQSLKTPSDQLTRKAVTGNRCPTCHGTGRVNKDEEHKLVALIPLDDNRLKPRRIWMWISGTTVLCSIIAITLAFIFIPRSIQIANDTVNVEPYNITNITGVNTSKVFGIAIYFNENYKIQNNNFYSIKMSNLTLDVTRISQVNSPDISYEKNVILQPRSSTIVNVKVKYTMYSEDDPYADLCIKNFINQLFTLISTTFSFSTIWNSSEESHLKSMQYLTCNNSSKYRIHI